LAFVADAMTSLRAETHASACENIFRHMGCVRKNVDVIDPLQAGTGEA
jgi:hypothetical protein